MKIHGTTLSSFLLVSSLLLGTSVATVRAEDGTKSTVLSDRQMVHHIHGAIVEDDTLPYCAEVVRVDSTNGKVTLTGKVHTEEEKTAVEEKSATIAGDDNVTSQIRVKGS